MTDFTKQISQAEVNRREFMRTSLLLTGGALLGSPTLSGDPSSPSGDDPNRLSGPSEPISRFSLSLNGTWTASTTDGTQGPVPAPVPGTVHDALLDAEVLSDLHRRFNERTQYWVGTKDWVFERSFSVNSALLAGERIELCCDGLDTLATIEVNGVIIASTDNMFRFWRWDVKPLLHVGENRIRVVFASIIPYLSTQNAKHHLPAWNEPEPGRHWGITGRGYIRKQACQGGWDWGEMALTAGIYKSIRLESWSQARLGDWRHTQHNDTDGSVRVHLATTLLRTGGSEPLSLRARLLREGQSVAEVEVTTTTDNAELELNVSTPALWWPNGMGDQPLYDLEIRLIANAGHELDVTHARIGLRTLELVREADQWGTSFVFACNGRKFFAKGSNIVPLDQHPTSRNVSSRYRHIVKSARMAHMNMLRVWGGGYYLHQEFYDLCDEQGICVWQDMMFGCGSYPFSDPVFRNNVVQETKDNARALRHHASLAVWCGNNELEMGFCTDEDRPQRITWEEYLPFFDQLIPTALREVDPVTAYIPGSPHSGPDERKDHSSPRSGDFHLWEVWFSEAPFENYRNYPQRFISEFGFQSLPELYTLQLIGATEDLSFNSPVMEFHQRSQPGMRRIMGHLLDYFRLPSDLARQARLSQLVHGLGLKEGIEYWRTTWPRCSGATYWQLNDVWPAPTWSSIDVTGRWKAVHYFVRRMFAPILVTGVAHRIQRTCDIHLVNDTASTLNGTVTAFVANGVGDILAQWSFPANAAAYSTTPVTTLDLRKWVDPTQQTDAALWLRFTAATGEVSENLVLLDRPKQLVLRDPQSRITFSEPASDGSRQVEVSVSAPAYWVELSSSALTGAGPFFDDNYVSVFPGLPWRTTFRPGVGSVGNTITIRSLIDQLP